MLYNLLKLPAKLAFLIWCRHLLINKKEILNAEGPLLIAANHPNSFLDAVLLCTLFKKPVYSLARGDVFANNFFAKILRALKMLPVYRLSEGPENLDENYKTFDECIKVFRKNGIVLIFSEGACVNEWNLRPLKKGTARLIIQAWDERIPLKIIPAGINYSSFSRFGKNIILNFGEPITPEDFPFLPNEAHGTKIQFINSAIKKELEKSVVQVKPVDEAQLKKIFGIPVSRLKKTLLFIPAIFGFVIHAPLYIPIQKFAYRKFGRIDHYNSVLVGMLFLLYPFYFIIVAALTYLILGGWWFIGVCILLPVTAYSFVQVKDRI